MEKYTLIVNAREVGLLRVLNYLARLWGLKKTNAAFGRRYFYLFTTHRYLKFKSLCFILEQLASKGWAKILTASNEATSGRRVVFFRKKKFSLAFLNLLKEELVRLPGKYGPRFVRKTPPRRSPSKRDARFQLSKREKTRRGVSGLIWAVHIEKNCLNYEFFKKELLIRQKKINGNLIFSIALIFFYYELLLQVLWPRMAVYLYMQPWYTKYH